MDPDTQHRLRTFGRTGGRPLSTRQQVLIDQLLPRLRVPDHAPKSLNPFNLFDNAQDVRLEIGFGGGEHFVRQASAHPDVGFIGCEPFIEGMAKALTGIENNRLHNVRLHMDDARSVIERLQDNSISLVYLLFPDPWPKRRHWKRRIVQPDFLTELHRILAPEGRLRFATDVKSYADDALATILAHGRLTWLAACAEDWRAPWPDHVPTRYQTKGLGDCAPVYFTFEKPAD